MERSKHLHNFNLPPRLTWGRQKLLRCMNVNPVRPMPAVDDDDESSDSGEDADNRLRSESEGFHRFPGERSSNDVRRRSLCFKLNSWSSTTATAADIGSVSKAVSGDEDQISATREKLMMEYHADIEKIQKSILEKKSWKRLASKSKPTPSPIKICSAGVIKEPVDPRSSEKKSTRPRRNIEKKEERPKFSISLSRKEIEDDFFAMTGKKPPRKPNKLPKNIQMKLDAVFPGSWLSEVHPDRYKVNENGKI